MRFWPFGLSVGAMLAAYFAGEFSHSQPSYAILVILGLIALILGLLIRAGHSVRDRWPWCALFVVISYSVYYGLRPTVVIAPFHLPEGTKENGLPFSGETVAGVLADALNGIQREANGEATRPPCLTKIKGAHFVNLSAWGAAPEPARIEGIGTATVEVKGISLEALVALAHRVLHTERVISGDVIVDPNKEVYFMARSLYGENWRVGPYPMSEGALETAGCELGESILREINPRRLAAFYVASAQYRQMLELFDSLSAPPKQDSHLLLDDALALDATGQPDKAIAALRLALKGKPESPGMLYVGLGSVLSDSGHLNEAIDQYHIALMLIPRNAVPYNGLGIALLGQGRIDDAIKEFRRSIELKPDLAEAHTNLGIALARDGRREEAVAEYRTAIELEPELAEAHGSLGAMLADLGHTDEAVYEYRRAIVLKPDYWQAHSNLGRALLAQGHADEAVVEFRKTIELRPTDRDSRYNLGNALRAGGKIEESISAYERAVEINPESADAHYRFGSLLLSFGRLDQSARELRRAIELRPDYAEAENDLGAALARMGRAGEAIPEYRKAIRLRPDYFEAQYNLGSLLGKRGQTDEAITHLETAIRLKPSSVEAHSDLGLALALRGRYRDAAAELDKALAIDPHYEPARRRLQQVHSTLGQGH
jgi:tetratricopeptide (TPR) repeat protein